MLAAVFDLLACPHCAAALAPSGAGAACPQGHSFDLSRQGYLSLLQPGALTGSGDDAAMVRNRQDFLAAGHYDRLRARVRALATGTTGGLAPAGGVLDLGGGTGWYAADVLAALPGRVGVVIDTSKPALRVAARLDPRLGAVAADAWKSLPVRDSSVGVALDVFAPRNSAELARVLRADGALVVVVPGPDHLRELRRPLGLLDVQEGKQARLLDTLGSDFSLRHNEGLRYEMAVARADAATLAGMGPSARHISPTELAERVAALPEQVAVTADFALSLWRPRSSDARD
ncbi:23S rRNA (guanine745-N1)-methyltransferase [Motilibacter peucedani]|uniref:23S rRNA (Guanine745-N1)-methyltransferase n=1 Tax=Motilibacter peucedani TaxID=598650 RepID=A0A420XK56_9ACTN|nr:methyltransferase domain-containing protein [Motilibacter peucedani]RKS68013.1 23S rRNA (guanine745-N1)-methyltransferase [Motilibacter peucedani]